MNFFENELRKLFADTDLLDNPSFVGRACFGDVGKDLRARIEFTTTHTVDHYSALQVTLMNRTAGVVDRLTLRLEDILGLKSVPGNPNFPNGVSPHIWVYRGEAEWYAFKPAQADYQKLRESVGSYIDVFRPREDRKPDLASTIQSAEARGALSHGPADSGTKLPSRPER